MKTINLILFIFIVSFIPLNAEDANPAWDDDDFFDELLLDEWFLMEGEGLTILGSIPTTQQMGTVNRETIERINAPDIPTLLQEALGLGVTRYGPYGNMTSLNLRGFNIRRVAILVDGLPVNSIRSGNFDFYTINPLSIERVEVIYGGSDTRFNVSGALGGVINIITIREPDPGWTFGVNFSNTSYLPGNYRTSTGDDGTPHWRDLADTQSLGIFASYGSRLYSINLSAFATRAGNHFLYTDPFNFTRRKESNEVFNTGVSASFLRSVGDFSTIIASTMLHVGDRNIPVSGFAVAYSEQRDIASRINLMLDMPRSFHDDFSMELVLGHGWQRFTLGDASRHNEHSVSVINRWGWHPSRAFTQRVGWDYRFVNIDSTQTGLHTGHRAGLYTTTEFSPVNNLLFIASVKGVTDGSQITPIPKLGWLWTVNENLNVRNNFFRAFKFPDFDDLYWTQAGFTGNPDLNNEDGWGADIGAELSLGRFGLNSVFYAHWIDDSIHWTNVFGTWRPENSGTAAFAGLDNRVNVELPLAFGVIENPIVSFSWLFQLSWLLSGELTFADSRRIPYMPMHTVGASLQLPWTTRVNQLPGRFTIAGRFESLRYVNTQNTRELPSVFLLNLIYNQRLNDNISIFGRINNALNVSYESFADYPMPGISFTIGINTVFTPQGRR